MKTEYTIGLIIGLLILTYVLDAIVNPLSPALFVTPYHYFDPSIFTKYAFTSTSIVLKAIAVLLIPLVVLKALDLKATAKGVILLILSGLAQLYALQDTVTRAQILPLEWDISLTLAALVLIIPSIIYILAGLISDREHKDIFSEEGNDDL